MNRKLALFVAVVMGILAVFLVNMYIKDVKRSALQGMEAIKVLVAANDLQKGTVLTPENVAFREYPKKYVAERAITYDVADFVLGSKLKVNIEKGKPIFWSDIITKAEIDAGLAAKLESGTYAMTIPVNQISGVAGLLNPGMRVDILFTTDSGCIRRMDQNINIPQLSAANIATQDVNAIKSAIIAPPKPISSMDSEKKKVTFVLLQNVLIVATGTRRIGIPPSTTQGDVTYNNVTLMLKPKEAQILSYCLNEGQITLALRKTGETDKIPDATPVSCNEVKNFLMENNAWFNE